MHCFKSPQYNIFFFLNFHKLYNYMYLSTGRTQTNNDVELGNITHTYFMKSFKLLLVSISWSLSCSHALLHNLASSDTPGVSSLSTWATKKNHPLHQASKTILQVFHYQKNDKCYCSSYSAWNYKVQCPYNYSLQQNLLQAMVLSQLTKPLLRHVVQVSLQITTRTSSTWKCT
jgi:hypothetical protein